MFKELPKRFLQDCIGLTTLDLSPLTHITKLNVGFLEGCSGLKELDLSPLRRVEYLPVGFLWGCRGLTTLDLSPIVHLKELTDGFLDGCTGLTTLDLGPNWERLPMVRRGWYEEKEIPLSLTRRRMETAEEVQAFMEMILAKSINQR